MINNNSNNCAKVTHQLTCNNVLINNKNYINSSNEDNNENILNNGVNVKLNNNKQSIDTVDCTLINHSNNHQTTTQSSFQSTINHSTHFNLNTSSSLNHHYEQSATNQQQFNQLINTNGLSGSCSQLNNYSTSNTNLMTNHSMSLSNLTNLSTASTKYNSLGNFQPQINSQCNCCFEHNNNLINENRSWIPKFNSFGNDASEPVEILPHLLLGSELHASQLEMLKRIGVTALLNVSHSCPNHFEKDFVYKCIPVQDSSFEDISVYFDDAIQFIGKFSFYV